MKFIPPSSQTRTYMCARLLPLVLICLIPLIGSAQNTPPAPAIAPPPEASPQCGLHSPGRCAIDIAKDQAQILSGPSRIRKKDLVWITPFVAATATAFVFDRKTLDLVSTNPSRVGDYRTASDFTGIYMPLAGIGASWLTGVIRHDDYLRETGYLAGEALADTALFTTMFKYAANRVRPQSSGSAPASGKFWPDDKSYPGGDSFPSGHSAAAFAFAHVMASRYPGWKVKLGVYGLAAATAFARVAGREHFPSDVLAGGAIGYLIGGYVVHLHQAGPSRNHITVSPMVGANGLGVSLVFSRSDRAESR
jgi:membrane-associated phospholipid phosphatase